MKRAFSIQFTFNMDLSGKMTGDWPIFHVLRTKEGRT